MLLFNTLVFLREKPESVLSFMHCVKFGHMVIAIDRQSRTHWPNP